jgi:hypothetical protein
MYKLLCKHLQNTRLSLWDVCDELDIDYGAVDQDQLQRLVTQCTHCDIWTKKIVLDLDQNPVCKLCADLVGL